MAEYTGVSVVDYLASKGQDSSYASREKLASQYGISGYQGTAAQNTALLAKLRAGTPAPAPVVPASQAAQGVTQYDVNVYRDNLANFGNTQTSTPSGVPVSSGNPIVAALQPTQTISAYTPPVNSSPAPISTPAPISSPYTPAPVTAPKNPALVVGSPEWVKANSSPYTPPTAPANPALVVGSPEWVKANSSPYTPTAPATSPVARPVTPTAGAAVLPPTGTPSPVTPAGTPSTPTAPTDDLARRAGEAGLSLQEYQTLMESRNTVTKEESDAIAKELGISALEGEVFKKPSQSSQQIFDQAYQTAGLGNIKAKVDAVMEKADRIRTEALAAISEIDENPFLTEKSRVGRGKRVLDRAQGEVDNLMKQAEELNAVYKSGVDEINAMVTRNTYDFGVNQQIDQAKLNYLIKKAEVQTKQKGDTKKKLTDEQLGSYLSGRKAATAAKAKEQTIGSPETGYYRWDETLQKFIQVVAPSSQTALENEKLRKEIANIGESGFKPTADQKALVGRFLSTEDGRALTGGIAVTEADMAELMKDSATFYAVLQKANEAGIY